MDIGSFFLVLALLTLVILFISQPFLEKQRSTQTAISEKQDHELSTLLAEHDRVLNALQELDFDYALGKIPEEDYPGQRARLLQYGGSILRQLDELEGRQPNVPNLTAEARIEAKVAARQEGAQPVGKPAPNGAYAQTNHGKVVPAAVAAPDDDVEVLLAQRRRVRQDEAAGFCSKCGAALQKSDKFCPKCGKKIV